MSGDFLQRCLLTQATREAFADRPFAYGKADCLSMVHAHLTAFGYQLPPLPRYRGASGARKALAGQGAESLIDLVSRYLEPIPPAFMLPGDVLAAQGDPFDSLAIHSGQLLFGWTEWQPQLSNFYIDPTGVQRAWRVQFQDKV
jgi:hypothetical protein